MKCEKESPIQFEDSAEKEIDTSEYVGSYQHPGKLLNVTLSNEIAYGTIVVNETETGSITVYYNLLYFVTTYFEDDLFFGYMYGPPTLDPIGPIPIEVSYFMFKFSCLLIN